MSITRFTT